MNFLKKLKTTDIVIALLFVLISVLAVIILGIKGLLLIPILLLLVIIYYNIDKIILFIKKKRKKEKIEVQIEESKEVDDVMKIKSKKKVNKIKNKKDRPKRKIWKRILSLLLVLAIFMVLAVAAFLVYIVSSAGTFDPEALKNQEQTIVYDANGEIIATLGAQKRENITYDQLPQVLVDAILATEDSRFYQHNGVDLARFLKASVSQVLGNDDAGGASTLTMQVVKNNLTSTEKSIIRKFKDVYLAVFFVEKKYTKEEIIELYVNDSLLGSDVFGVGQASEYYFGKSVSELSLPEASLIAGLFQAPNGYNPYKNPEAAAERREMVLKLMVRHGYITQEEADMANAVDVSSMLVGLTEEIDYQGYIDTVVEEVIKLTKGDGEYGDDPYTVPMKIYTNMNKDIQDGINAVLSGEAYSGWVDDYIQAGIAVTDVNSGAIVAVGAGRNRTGEKVFNYATHAKRQPGSTSKPLFDYGPGFEYNNYSTYTLFNDEPWTYTNGPDVGNWDGGYYGVITLREALSVSRNVPALKAFQQVSKKNIYNFIKGLGLDPSLEDGVLHEAYSIGGGDGFTPLEMAVAYAAFANGGYYIEPHAVNKIEYRNTGEVVEFNYTKERVMKETTAYLVNNVLQYAVEYAFNGGARVYGSTVAAKTGTSNLDSKTIEDYGLPWGAVNDLWTVAYTPEYSIALWYGYEEITSEYYLSGASAPKDAVMSAIMQYIPKTTKEFTMPSSIVASQVEFGTWPAQLPSEYTPSNLIRTEYFVKGTEPTEVSDRFAKLSDVTNVKTRDTDEGTNITWSFTEPKVITQSYLENYFSQSVFGNSTSSLVAERLSYNASTLGDYGFGIYMKSDTGTLTKLGFTTNNEYTYSSKISSNVTLVIKAEYEKFKANASDGVDVKFSSTAVASKLKVDIGEEEITVEKGKFEEPGIKVTYNNKVVTSQTTTKITYSFKNETINDKKELEEKINALDVGTYKIDYNVEYKDETQTVTRTVIIK